MKKRFPPVVLFMLLAAVAGSSKELLAAGKKRKEPARPTQPSGPLKRAISLDPIPSRFIELADADAPMRVYGQNIYDELIAELKATDNFVVLLGGRDKPVERQALGLRTVGDDEPDPCNFSSVAIPSTHIAARVDEISFQTGSRGNRMFYGFRRGGENPYNSGYDANLKNEFPLKKVQGQPGWFGNTFADTGDLHTGLELGHEINFELLLVGAKLKKAEYHASLGLEVQFRNRVGDPERRFVTAQGHGFYFDLSGHLNYEGVDFIGGIAVARETAFLNAFKRTIKAMVSTITSEVSRTPLLTRLASRCDGNYYVAAGANYRVGPGQRFYSLTQLDGGIKPAVVTVEQVFQTSARVRVDGEARLGDEFVSLRADEPVPEPKPSVIGMAARSLAGGDDARLKDKFQTIDAGAANFDVPELLKQFVESYFKRLWAGIKAMVTLPYRAWRYFQYDQAYKGGEFWQVPLKRALELANRSWALKSIGAPEAWKNCQGDHCLGRREIIVAVLDSGIDYNHRELRRNIFWDGTRDTPGFDFISGDERPYDDHAHGTEVASLIAGGGAELVGVAPNVTVLPVKVFSPYGQTSSAAIYSGFQYAISMGAKIIVAAWATPRDSRALEDSIKMARDRGVLVVAAAGEGGFDLRQRPHYPASLSSRYDNVISVASHGQGFALTRLAQNESNTGADLAAPGEGVRVARPRDKYVIRSHTGAAAGFAAGAAALVWSHCPKINGLAIKQALTDGAQIREELRGEVLENKAVFLPKAIEQINRICN